MSQSEGHSFLTQAASAVPLGSSTSAYLRGVHTRLLLEESKSLNARQKKDYCAACGSTREPQLCKVTEIKPKPSKPLESESGSTGATVYKCLRCRKRTVLPSRKSPRIPVTKSSRAATVTSTRGSTPVGVDVKGSTSTSSDPKSSENQSSKKRAKARKQGGLQALLASRQRAQPSLDLFDFLQ
jgi:hypothetical protein